MKRSVLFVVCMMAVVLVAGAAFAAAANLTGKWTMKAGDVEYVLELAQTDANVTGTLSFADKKFDVAGTVAEAVATLEVKDGENVSKATVTVTADGAADWAVTEQNANATPLPAAGALALVK